MQIFIRSVSARVITDVSATLGDDDWYIFTNRAEDPDGELYDVLINDSIVILKAFVDRIQLDVGGIKADISEYDFRKVEIV